ncbi:MAG: ABC transporter [Alphaproteobacteria bacterium]|nr:ABC transporter [Alphaproteobacteria bacterium]
MSATKDLTTAAAGVTPAAAAVEPVLDVDGVTLQYKTKEHLITATYRVSFQTYPADRFVILGPSGCGKSTLLKGIAGYLHPVEGEMRLKGNVIKDPGPDRCMVFQEFDQLLPWKTVMGNITFALLNGGKCETQAEAREIAYEYIRKVKLDRFEDTFPHMLSGGMKQRVAIARAMAMEPDVLLMDEPFAALDALTRRQMQEELLQLWDDIRFTVIFVTHSIEEAVIVGSRILIMSPHPGQVKAEVNAHLHTHDDVGGEDFRALQGRIHDMIFADRVLEEETQPQHA